MFHFNAAMINTRACTSPGTGLRYELINFESTVKLQNDLKKSHLEPAGSYTIIHDQRMKLKLL